MKSKRVVTKIGDIFSVKIEKNSKRHFQLIAFDLTQLNSDVIRAFATAYPVSAEPNISDIVNDEVDFYAHCVIKWGVRLGFWGKDRKRGRRWRIERYTVSRHERLRSL